LDWLEEIVDHCHPGDSGSLASGWVSVVLELAFSKWFAGIGLGFGCTGAGFLELGVLAEEDH